ncbi:hypothetical protein FEF34_09240 [Streptomyces marianii]|uniref:Uncharacterized protein n=1 Tax=Streptomyces marianii TaxID=1817406 RepID=A0A5R9E1M8_9ACTN|nr:hypothetical protein FEF34_09240 [Streptomyces marianii]
MEHGASVPVPFGAGRGLAPDSAARRPADHLPANLSLVVVRLPSPGSGPACGPPGTCRTSGHLDGVAAEPNSRPRKTLDRETPAERLANLRDSP